MKYSATKTTTGGSPVRSATPGHTVSKDNPERSDLIATSAYYKAEERGFMPGHELDDWLKAEAEVNTCGEPS